MQIYKITRIDTGRVYIGLAKDAHKRWIRHVSVARQSRRPRSEIGRAMQIHGVERFELAVIETVPTPELGIRQENYWIVKFKELEPGVYNKMLGAVGAISSEHRVKIGNTRRGKARSADVKAKISASLRGISQGPRSAETKAKISAAQKGKPRKPLSAERLTRLIEANRGRKNSEETRAKMSAIAKARGVAQHLMANRKAHYARIGNERAET
jgi:group I intron endonuclease